MSSGVVNVADFDVELVPRVGDFFLLGKLGCGCVLIEVLIREGIEVDDGVDEVIDGQL